MKNVKQKISWIHDGEVLKKMFYFTKQYDILHHKLAYDYFHNCGSLIVPNYYLDKLLKQEFCYYFSYYQNLLHQKKWKLHTIPNFVKKIKIPNKKNIIIWAIPINRGLIEILVNWQQIIMLDPDIELHIYNNREEEYYINTKMLDLIEKYNNIFYFPKLPHHQLLEKISEAKYFLYPAQIVESFSIFTWECLIHQCIPIVYNIGALSTIGEYGGIVVKHNTFSEILKEWKFLLDPKNYQKRIQIIKNTDFSIIDTSNILQKWISLIKNKK